MHKQPEITEQTRQRIMDAYWSLALEDSILHITASSVAKRAEVNRSTFYEYFSDIVDLTEQIEEQFLDNFIGKFEEIVLPKLPLSLEEFSQISLKIFPIYADQMFYFLGKRRELSFENKLRDRMRPYLCQFTGLNPEMPYFKYIQTYILSVVRGFFVTWYEEGQVVPVEDLLPMGQKLVAEGLLGYAEAVRKK